MTIRVYNSLSRKKEEFVPAKGKKVGMYVCGPTVYDYFHIGNARIFIIFDVIRRYLCWRGYDVTFVQNFTDIDDKMIKRAGELGIPVSELAERYIEAYFADAEALGVRRADYHPRATEHIPEIIEIIDKLLAGGLAYNLDGDIYFHTPAFAGYGRLSHQPLDELVAGARIEVDRRKKHPLDFALWKKQKPGEPAWESPWGKGRPGWHVECSAMAMKYLGETVDIHGGGPDLAFPHHENEKAQSEGVTGRSFVRYWMHAGYLNVNREKMSKSLGNVLTVRDLRRTVDPLVIRFFMLSAHYRSPINFAPELLDQAQSGLERLNNVVYNLRDLREKLPQANGSSTQGWRKAVNLEEYRERFTVVMDDDFNTADAISVLFDLARAVNSYLKEESPAREAVEEILSFFEETGDILGFFAPPEKEELDAKIMEMIARRQAAREAKNWAEADAIRDELLAMGIILEDTPQGVRWRRK